MLDIDTLLKSDGLYITTMPDGRNYMWRLLTLKEYRIFRSLRETGTLSRYQIHDAVFDRCYTGNAALIDGDTPAGYTMSIGELIMWVSGDSAGLNDKEDLEIARSTYPGATVHEYMKRICLRAFPAYKIEDVEGWSRPLLIQRFVLAEELLSESYCTLLAPDGKIVRQPNYQPIELKSIMTAEQMAKNQKRQEGIDFQKENAQINQAMSGGEGHDLLDLSPDAFQKKMKIAKGMEARRGRGR